MKIVLRRVSFSFINTCGLKSTWKNVRKKSSFLRDAPRSKQTPHVSSMVQTSRTLKKSSGISRGLVLSIVGVPPASCGQISPPLPKLSPLTMAKGYHTIQSIENDRRVDHFVVV